LKDLAKKTIYYGTYTKDDYDKEISALSSLEDLFDALSQYCCYTDEARMQP
jgi:hypothetical protein